MAKPVASVSMAELFSILNHGPLKLVEALRIEVTAYHVANKNVAKLTMYQLKVSLT